MSSMSAKHFLADVDWFDFTINMLDDGLFIVDPDLQIAMVNHVASQVVGMPREKILGQNYQSIFDLQLGDLDCIFRNSIDKRLQISHAEGSLTTKDGKVLPVRVTASIRFNKTNQFAGGVLIFRDIQEIITLQDTLKHASIWDKLSGLFGRDHMFYLLELEFAKARRYKSQISIMIVDIDGLKQYNEQYGRETGDLIIKKVAKILRNNIRLSDIVGRLEGDRFVLILPQISKNGVTEMADRIRYLIEKSWLSENEEKIIVTASVGTASYPNFKVTDWKDMLKAADIALYMAKEMGRNRTESF